ncbi:hypothetical protein ACJMK2_000425 [Sinanodonta woodiana]|uniref:Cysteine and tyrosine-rich protein 1 n=1 Tax=Sinanodonta woodiana TaxID=1069815 RepID=A0ABD3XPP7_SINWO
MLEAFFLHVAICLYFVSFTIFILNVLPVVSGEYCSYSSTYYTYYYYCSYGCCGGSYSDVCCPLEGGAIAGIAIACIIVIILKISCIVYCCAAANKSSRRVGTVIQPTSTGMHTFVVNSTAVSQGQSVVPVGYYNGVQPPPYTQQGSSNPAFPAPPPAKY